MSHIMMKLQISSLRCRNENLYSHIIELLVNDSEGQKETITQFYFVGNERKKLYE